MPQALSKANIRSPKILFTGRQKVDLVPAREANVRYTDLVVKFYEDRIQWHAGHLLASHSSDSDSS